MFDLPIRSASIVTVAGRIALVMAVAAGCTQSTGASAAPTAAASAARDASSATTQIMGAGSFHDVDGTATGEAQLVVKPDGTYEVVLEGFKIEAIAHTNIVLVSNAEITATADIDKTKLLDLGPLKAAEGMQDFPIPAEMAGDVMEGYHTVVIWDTEMAHAIAAAPLG
jgi:hypothetical protein